MVGQIHRKGRAVLLGVALTGVALAAQAGTSGYRPASSRAASHLPIPTAETPKTGLGTGKRQHQPIRPGGRSWGAPASSTPR
jgi:hypothetical protein